MELYIGGFAQGKREYVKKLHEGENLPVVEELHVWVKELMEAGKDVEKTVLQFYEEHPDCIFICNEVGNGIVPMEKKEREYREEVGRLLIVLAGKADRVERIICGIGQRLK